VCTECWWRNFLGNVRLEDQDGDGFNEIDCDGGRWTEVIQNRIQWLV
jgi:hypothetical protein